MFVDFGACNTALWMSNDVSLIRFCLFEKCGDKEFFEKDGIELRYSSW
jgi:hypothetical protein